MYARIGEISKMLVLSVGGPEFDSQNPGENSECGGHVLAIPREAEG